MEPIVRPSVFEDAINLAPNLREADKRELFAASGMFPKEGLMAGFSKHGECFSVVRGEEVVAMFGASKGCVWLLAAELKEIKRPFLRESRAWVQLLLKRWGRLWNVVDERNTVHIQWIKWCGFTFTGRSYILHDPSVKFLEFELCAPRS